MLHPALLNGPTHLKTPKDRQKMHPNTNDVHKYRSFMSIGITTCIIFYLIKARFNKALKIAFVPSSIYMISHKPVCYLGGFHE